MRRDTIKLSLDWLRAEGWTAARVESWMAHGSYRMDLFGVADILAFNETECALIQVFARNEIKSHVGKLQANETIKQWVLHPSRKFYLHIWPRTGVKNDSLHVVEFSEENLAKLLDTFLRFA